MISDDEQQRYLADAIKVVREQAFYMKRAIDGDNLKISLDHATEVTNNSITTNNNISVNSAATITTNSTTTITNTITTTSNTNTIIITTIIITATINIDVT